MSRIWRWENHEEAELLFAVLEDAGSVVPRRLVMLEQTRLLSFKSDMWRRKIMVDMYLEPLRFQIGLDHLLDDHVLVLGVDPPLERLRVRYNNYIRNRWIDKIKNTFFCQSTCTPLTRA